MTNPMSEWEERTYTRLRTHVPPIIRSYQRIGGPSEQDVIRIRPYGTYIAAHGDTILFPDGKGNDEIGLAKLLEGVAILSFSPGGINLFDLTFDAATFPPEEPQNTLHSLITYCDELFQGFPSALRRRYETQQTETE